MTKLKSKTRVINGKVYRLETKQVFSVRLEKEIINELKTRANDSDMSLTDYLEMLVIKTRGRD